jgi:hypothetical protein
MDFFFNSHHGAIDDCGCGAQAERLPGKATFSEERAFVQNADGGLFAALGHNAR